MIYYFSGVLSQLFFITSGTCWLVKRACITFSMATFQELEVVAAKLLLLAKLDCMSIVAYNLAIMAKYGAYASCQRHQNAPYQRLRPD
jgi:hypothetical protein